MKSEIQGFGKCLVKTILGKEDIYNCELALTVWAICIQSCRHYGHKTTRTMGQIKVVPYVIQCLKWRIMKASSSFTLSSLKETAFRFVQKS